jgi:hypothetical protein
VADLVDNNVVNPIVDGDKGGSSHSGENVSDEETFSMYDETAGWESSLSTSTVMF